ncbi:MAG: hypothetical protein Q9196_000712 [Gyalolechia fulgens]
MAFLLSGFVAVALGLILYRAGKFLETQALARANGCQPPKKFPHADPFLGIDLFLQAGKLFEENRYLLELIKRYAENGRTFQTNLFGTASINTIEPENLRTIYSAKFLDWGVQPIRLPAQEPFCGRGVITTDGQAWEHSRSLLQPSFRRSNIADLSILETYLTKVIDRIPTDGSTFDLQPAFFSLYLDTATLFLFGESFDSLSGSTSEEGNRFMDAFDYAMFGSGFRIALGPFKVLWRSSKWRDSCLTTHRFADRYVEKAIQYRRKLQSERGAGDANEATAGSQNLLYSMAEQTGDRVQLRNEVLQAVMAAQETTAVLISNGFFLLARHPAVWDRLRQEALSLSRDQVTMDALLNMKYLRNVLNETLRDTVLPRGGGPDGKSSIFVRKGTMFDTAFYVLHRQRDIWGDDAEAFKPDRWDTFKPETWQYQPFGGGPRACIGRQKALTEASYVIVRILQEFHHIESRDAREWTGKVQLTAKNANGCKVALFRA